MASKELTKEKIRYILQFFFDKGENASKTANILNEVYGPDTISANCVQFWFRRFRSDPLDVNDAPRAGRPSIEIAEKIKEMIRVDPHITCRSIAQELKVSKSTVLSHLHKAGYSKKIDVWVQRQSTPRKKSKTKKTNE